MLPVRKIQYILNAFGLGGVRVFGYNQGEDIDAQARVYGAQVINDGGFVGAFGVFVVGSLTLAYEAWSLSIDAVLVDVSMTRNIIKTPIQGLSGTVKEYIADGDFDITIRGVLVSQDNAYPQDDFAMLLHLCKIQYALEVQSDYLQIFNIYNLVVEDYSFPQREGFENTQLFELRCVSDQPIELLLLDETLN